MVADGALAPSPTVCRSESVVATNACEYGYTSVAQDSREVLDTPKTSQRDVPTSIQRTSASFFSSGGQFAPLVYPTFGGIPALPK